MYVEISPRQSGKTTRLVQAVINYLQQNTEHTVAVVGFNNRSKNELKEKEYSNKWNKDLTSDENAHINELKGKYQALKVKAALKDMKNELNDIIEQSKSFVEELISDSTANK